MGAFHAYHRKNLKDILKVILAVIGMTLVAPTIVLAEGETTELPVRLPDLPADIYVIEDYSLPTIYLPEVDSYEWPSALDEIEARTAAIEDAFADQRSYLSVQISRVSTKMNQVRVFTNKMRGLVGSPLTVSVSSDSVNVNSAYAIALQLSSAIETSISYLRSLSAIGPTGLNLTFIFLGLAWLMILNALDLLVNIIVGIRKFLIGVIEWLLKILRTIFDFLQLVRALAFL
jgi:hypothetical protein